MKHLAAFCWILFSFGLYGQGTPVDCSSTFTFTTTAVQAGQANLSNNTPCVAFRVTFSVTGTLTAVIQFETSPDNVTFTPVPSTICSSTIQPPCLTDGANPMASGPSGTVAVRAYDKYWRLNATSTTGAGTGTARIYGYKGTSASAGTGGGGSPGPATGASLFTSTADATDTNSTAELSIVGTGVGSKTTPANYFSAGTSLVMELGGYYTYDVPNPNLTIRIKANSVVVGSTGANKLNAEINGAIRLYALITCRTTGASGTFQVDTIFESTTTQAPTFAAESFTFKIINTSDVVLDTTGTLAWDITAQWASASTAVTITGKTFAMFTPGTGPQGANGPEGPGVSGLTANVIPKAATPTTLTNSSITDNGTTVTGTEPIVFPSGTFNAGISTGASPPACTAGTGGALCQNEGTAPTAVAAVDQLYADSALHSFAIQANGGSPALVQASAPGRIASTGLVAAVSTATLCAASAGACNQAGQYRIDWNFVQGGTACATPGTGGVTFLLTWTDHSGTHSAVSIPMIDSASLVATSGTFTFRTANTSAYASGTFNIQSTGAIIQYATGYTACGVGTGTYELNATVTRLQ